MPAISLEDLSSCDKLNLGVKGLHSYMMMTEYVAQDDSGLSLARRKDHVFLEMDLVGDKVSQACYQRATGKESVGESDLDQHLKCILEGGDRDG